jgi:hypothetical protein
MPKKSSIFKERLKEVESQSKVRVLQMAAA